MYSGSCIGIIWQSLVEPEMNDDRMLVVVAMFSCTFLQLRLCFCDNATYHVQCSMKFKYVV